MKLTVLGKYGPYPKEGDHASSCYLVQGGSTSLVLDMGPGSLFLDSSMSRPNSSNSS